MYVIIYISFLKEVVIFMNKTKLFISASFDSKHKDFYEQEAAYLLRNDIRSKILGDVNSFLNKPKKNESLLINPEIVYVGGYYYYAGINTDTFEGCEKLVDTQLKEIDTADLVLVVIDRCSAIATMSELLYAAYKNKEIVIFADPKVCKLDINSKYWYAIEMAKTYDDNITFINYKDVNEIIDYLRKYKKNNLIKPLKNNIITREKNSQKNIFISCHYDFDHRYVNKENIVVLAQNDIRSKLVGDVRSATFENDVTFIKKNKNLKYVGGFYYYYLIGDRKRDSLKEYEMKSNAMILRLKQSDIVCCVLNNYESYGVVAEFLYASFLKKKVNIYYYKQITDFKKNKEYWFPIIMACKINNDTSIIDVKKEEDIIKSIENIDNDFFI